MSSIEIRIPGEPVAQARHRTSFKGGKQRQYDPSAIAKKDMLRAARDQHPSHVPYAGPLSASIVFCLARPASHFRADGNVKPKMLDALPTKRPDIDNLSKGLLDAMNGFIYLDDKQITSLCASKIYGTRAYTWAKFTEIEA